MSTENAGHLEASQALKDRAYLLLKALVRASYFGDLLPDESRLVQMLQIPRWAVTAAIEQLRNENTLETVGNGAGYRRLPSAIHLPNGRVALLLNTNMFTRWYGIFQDYLIGFEETMRDNGCEVIFRSDFEKLAHKAETIEEFRRNGIRAIAFCSYAEPRLRQLVLERRIPAVILGNATIQQRDLGCVCSDNSGGMSDMTEFLISKNHRHIAYYTTGPQSHDGFQKRLVGYEAAMINAGLNPTRDLVIRQHHSSALASQACQRFLNMRPRPTAIACSCDREAFELMAELQKSRIRVPDDVSITGFDNNIFGGITEPSLTSVEIYARDIGRVGAHYLLNEMERAQLPIQLVLPTYLISRKSVAPFTTDATPPPVALNKKTSKILWPEEEPLIDY